MKASKLFPIIIALVLITSLFAGCSNINEKIPSVTESISETPDENSGNEKSNYETDNIVNTTAAEKVILVVSFGTSYNQTRHLNIGAIETAIKEAYPDYQVRRAFTSQTVINKLSENEGLKIDSVTEAMDRLILDKAKEVVIIPTTVMNGFEFDDMVNEVKPYSDRFEILKIGKQLLGDDDDYTKIVELLVAETSQFRADDTAIILMGHGSAHQAGTTYAKLHDLFNQKGYNDYIVGTIDNGIKIDDIQKMLAERNVKKVVLRPFMIVAGEHATNDMAGNGEDSWKSILEKDGYEVEIILEGLGQIEGVQKLFVSHVKDAIDSDSISVSQMPTADGVTSNRIKNGTYSIEVESDASMFRIVDCNLTNDDNGMTAVITLSGQGYGALYMGTAEKAIGDEKNHIKFTLEDEKHSFTIPVAMLDKDIQCSAFGSKSGKWFDHTLVFKSNNIPSDSFVSKQINVKLSGGSGKASIDSPATLFYKDGKNITQIIWSSPNYTYMLIDGVEYLPVNKEGNSTFEIPVKLDTDMAVIACTVAMGSPREIEYTLHFDSSSVK